MTRKSMPPTTAASGDAAPTRRSPATRIGVLPSGPLDHLSDVGGVTVGHATLDEGPLQTGVTVVLPQAGDGWRQKLPAGHAVFNGFGKSVGLMQLAELGTLETPIALTNTFSVGAVLSAMIRSALRIHPRIGRDEPTINPLVFECNDGYLNDLQAMAIDDRHYEAALTEASAGGSLERGAIGAGRGMSAFGVKGGIGSASRQVVAAGHPYTVGALVLANFGRPDALTVAGRRWGEQLVAALSAPPPQAEQGSIIMLLATDAPLDARQLGRLARRAGVGLARTGSDLGHGSGDIALAWSTAVTRASPDHTPHAAAPALLPDDRLDPLFQGAAEATEQAILDALLSATTVVGRDGHCRRALIDVLPALGASMAGRGD